jgi:hypothetical protein
MRDQDPFALTRGAFTGLLANFKEKVNIQRAGSTFAVSAAFPWLTFGFALRDNPYNRSHLSFRNWKGHIYQRALERYTEKKGRGDIDLFLPAPSAAMCADIDSPAAIGGGFHEFGHALCDCAQKPFPSYKVFEEKLGQHLRGDVPYDEYGLPEMVNLLADMRLEPGFVMVYPGNASRFHAIQSWIHNLEAEVRGTNQASDFKMAMRDAGKGWRSPEADAVYMEYSEGARKMVEDLRPIWSQVLPQDTDWERSAHLPVKVAVEMVNTLQDFLKSPPGGGQGEGEGQGQESDQEGQEGQEGQGEGQEERGEKSGKIGGGNQGLSLDEIEALLRDRSLVVHDPSSAMEQKVREVQSNSPHQIYVPNGKSIKYGKLSLK